MKHKVLLVGIVVLLLVVTGAVVLAQDGGVTLPPQLPDTAADLVSQVAVFIAVLAGTIGNRLTERVKAVFYFLKDGEQTELSRLLTDLAAFIVTTAAGYGLAQAAVAAQWLDTTGVWAVVVLAYPVALGWFQVDGRRKAATL